MNMRTAHIVFIWAMIAPFSDAADPIAARYWSEAWAAASAITNDAQDQATWQMRVLAAGSGLGLPADELEQKARQLTGWWKWGALADLAFDLAVRQQTNEARRLALEALYKSPLFREDEHDRILLRALWALAALGDVPLLSEYETRYAGVGRTAAEVRRAAAIARAVQDGTWSSLSAIDSLPDERSDADTEFRLRLARLVAARLKGDERNEWADALWAKTADTSGYRRIDERLELIDTFGEFVGPERMRAWLEQVASDIANEPAPAYVRALQWADLAHARAAAGDVAGARAAAGHGRRLAEQSDGIERPVILGRVARALSRAGDVSEAEAVFAEALEAARSLENLRPRSIALARIYLAQAGVIE